MSEQKKPQAGEFWECDERVQIIGTMSDGTTIAENSLGVLRGFNHKCGWKHLPDCTGFDWQPETFPQWYISGNPIGCGLTAYVVRDSQTTYFCVDTNGVESRSSAYWFDRSLVTSGAWKQVTQAEAEGRVKIPQPVNLMNCPDCGEFRGHGHDEICKAMRKPNYVRLWTHRTSGTVCSATDERYLKYPDIWTELKHDGTGFYLEGGN